MTNRITGSSGAIAFSEVGTPLLDRSHIASNLGIRKSPLPREHK